MANESLLDTSEAQATPKSKTLCQESLQGSDGNIDFESIVIAKTRHQVPVSCQCMIRSYDTYGITVQYGMRYVIVSG